MRPDDRRCGAAGCGRPVGRPCLAAVVAAVVALGCGRVPAPASAQPTAPQTADPIERFSDEPELSPDALHERLVQLMGLPRTLGHPRRAEAIDALAEALRRAGTEPVVRHELSGLDPTTGETFALVNLYAAVRPDAPRRFVIATHFDTRPWADADPDPSAQTRPVPGANDGSSGVAVVLALVAVLARRLPADVGFTVALFDGEELGRPDDDGGYCIGSRALARTMNEPSSDDSRAIVSLFDDAELGIVLDMVGDADLRMAPEPGSLAQNPALMRTLWAVAAERGHQAFDDRARALPIMDDHTFLGEAGVPSVLLIDYEYDAWHTEADTLDRVSGTSMAVVADTVLATLLQHYRG